MHVHKRVVAEAQRGQGSSCAVQGTWQRAGVEECVHVLIVWQRTARRRPLNIILWRWRPDAAVWGAYRCGAADSWVCTSVVWGPSGSCLRLDRYEIGINSFVTCKHCIIQP